LVGANLAGADLRGADMTDAPMNRMITNSRADEKPEDIVLMRAVLTHANLLGAVGLRSSDITTCIDWQLAFYDSDMLKQLGLPPDHNEKLQKQMEAELQQAKSATTTSAK